MSSIPFHPLWVVYAVANAELYIGTTLLVNDVIFAPSGDERWLRMDGETLYPVEKYQDLLRVIAKDRLLADEHHFILLDPHEPTPW